MKMDKDRVLQLYWENYCKIFKTIYPSKNNTGFTERNLSVNFANAYQDIYPDAVVWYEFQFGENNNLHYDAIILNPSQKELIIIEAKRFSQLPKKIKQVGCDINRINEFITTYTNETSQRLPNLTEYSILGIILADVWTELPSKIAIKEAFDNKCFLQKYSNDLQLVNLPACEYFCKDFADVPVTTIKEVNTIPEKYYLLGLIWDIT